MSLILDALNRSRSDAEPVPGLATEHPVTEDSRGLRRYLPWGAFAVSLLVIGWLLVDREKPAEVPAAAPVAELSQNVSTALTSVKEQLKTRAAEQEAGATTAPPTAPRAPAPQSAAAEAAELPQPAAPQQPAPIAKEPATLKKESSALKKEPSALKEESSADPAAQEIAQLYAKSEPDDPAPQPAVREASTAQSERQAAATTSEEPVDLEQILQRAENEVENARLVEHPAPFLADLSQRTKDEIPTILYQQHDYSDTRGRSTVVLNGKTLRDGGSAGAGLKVDEILSDSVVLSYRGTQFRLRALNSWVNL